LQVLWCRLKLIRAKKNSTGPNRQWI